MNPTRRACLRASAALAAASSMPWLAGCAEFGPGDLPGSLAYRPKGVRGIALRDGVARTEIGSTIVTSLRDGSATMPLDESFVPGVPLAQVRQALDDAGLRGASITIPFTAFVVERRDRRMLLDAGNGRFGAPGSGLLLANLRDAGIDPASIHDVLITHFHGDHINGLRDADGKLAFPNATIHVPQPEWDWWMDDARMRASPAAMRGAFEATRRVFGSIAADVRRFAPGADALPGIASIPAYGHTPGHTGFGFEDGGHRFAYLGDVTNIAPLFLRHPDWAVRFDMDPEAARRTRRSLLDQAVAGNWVVAGFHWPGSAMGRVARRGSGYEFAPLVP
ncbi:MAG: MBL fold metallo-hydrolase [Burkholderiaceae bacterium]|nr:MBL fold metallo-hydrolase [Burkholderiaceae bacterium]